MKKIVLFVLLLVVFTFSVEAGTIDTFIEAYDLDGNKRDTFYQGEQFEVRVYVEDNTNKLFDVWHKPGIYDAQTNLLSNTNVRFINNGGNGEIYSLPLTSFNYIDPYFVFEVKGQTIDSIVAKPRRLLYVVDALAVKAHLLTTDFSIIKAASKDFTAPTPADPTNKHIVTEVSANIHINAPATCSDGYKNQDETDVDCGGVCVSTTGRLCPQDKSCKTNVDCNTGLSCVNNVCKDVLVLGLLLPKEKTLLGIMVSALKNYDSTVDGAELDVVIKILAALNGWLK